MTAGPIVVVGAGAAGTMAAIHAAQGHRPVVLLEGTRDGGRKILISGGGRCNILPAAADPARFVTDSPAPLVRHILRGWPLAEQRKFFEQDLELPLVLEEETGKLFPAANRARVVRDTLLRAARERGVELRFGVRVTGLEPLGPGQGWRVLLAGAEPLRASRVVLATGGLSVPATGSDGAGLAWLEALGHRLHPRYPALTPLTGDAPAHHALAGVSLVSQITARGHRPPRQVTGGLLFTHRGWSGPAVLDLSHLATRSRMAGGSHQALLVRWTPADAPTWEGRLHTGAGQVVSALREQMPDRLAGLLLAESGVAPGTPLAQLRRDDRRRLVAALTEYPLPWSGDEGYRKAEVTGGGLALDEVQPHTLESRRNSGLHVCGEALDAFGPIGGHNFLWAWATGRLAGRAAGGQTMI